MRKNRSEANRVYEAPKKYEGPETYEVKQPHDSPDGKMVQRGVPVTYRGVRSMKHKNQRSQEGLRKCNSLTDLSSKNTQAEEVVEPEPVIRSKSRESVYDSFPRRHHAVGSQRPSLNDSLLISSDQSISSSHEPKTFYQTLKESYNVPPPPPPVVEPSGKAKVNSQYMKYASIPHDHSIENYEGHQEGQEVSFLNNLLASQEVYHPDRLETRSSSVDDLLAASNNEQRLSSSSSSGHLISTHANNGSLHSRSYSTPVYQSNMTSGHTLYTDIYTPGTEGRVIMTRTSIINHAPTTINPSSSSSINNSIIHSSMQSNIVNDASMSTSMKGSVAPPPHSIRMNNAPSLQETWSNKEQSSTATPAVPAPEEFAGASAAPSSPRRDNLSFSRYLSDTHSQNETDESKVNSNHKKHSILILFSI